MELCVGKEKAEEVGEILINYCNLVVHHLRRLFLVEDMVDSAKFAVMLYCLTYIGGWFNGLTLIILGKNCCHLSVNV